MSGHPGTHQYMSGTRRGVIRWAQTEASSASTGARDRSALSLEEIFQAHVHQVHRLVRRLAGPKACEADVDDLTQQVFINVHRALPKYRGEGQLSTWLYGIAARTVLHHHRSRTRWLKLLDRFSAQPQAHSTDGLRLVEDRSQLARIEFHLGKLSPEQRAVYLLMDIEGLTGPEVCSALELKEGTVRSRLRAARNYLQSQLEKDEAHHEA